MYVPYTLKYLNDEHQTKYKKPLPSPESWESLPSVSNTNRQENGKFCIAMNTCPIAIWSL